jgi:hypothetical protein
LRAVHATASKPERDKENEKEENEKEENESWVKKQQCSAVVVAAACIERMTIENVDSKRDYIGID